MAPDLLALTFRGRPRRLLPHPSFHTSSQQRVKWDRETISLILFLGPQASMLLTSEDQAGS